MCSERSSQPTSIPLSFNPVAAGDGGLWLMMIFGSFVSAMGTCPQPTHSKQNPPVSTDSPSMYRFSLLMDPSHLASSMIGCSHILS